MRLLVTGSRDWPWSEEGVIWEALFPYLPERGSQILDCILVHGACPKGADEIARTWWTANGGIEDPHPADWAQYGKRAGYVRNAEMVNSLDPETDVCLAFIKDNSPGATMCARLAEKAGIKTVRYFL